MLVILRVESGPSAGKNCTLRSGQRVKVGSTARADFSVAGDMALAPEHFEISASNNSCTLTTINNAAAQLNDVPVSQTDLTSGDRIIAGSSTFSITIEGTANSRGAVEEQAVEPTAPVSSGYENVQECSAANICEQANLPASSIALLEDGMTPAEFVTTLRSNGHTLNAIRFLAAGLSSQDAVAWAARCLLPFAGDSAALQAAIQWAEEPSDQTMQQVRTAVDADGPSSAAGYLAQAVTYTAELAPDVPPPSSLLPATLSGALELAVAGDSGLLEQFLNEGIATAAPEAS